MGHKGTLVLGLLLFYSVTCVAFNFAQVQAINDYRVRNVETGLSYTTIQGAIDANETLNGHTLHINAGIYCEHVVVNKSLSLIGENRSTTVVDGNGTGIVIDAVHNVTTIVNIVAQGVTVSGLTVRNGGFHGITLNCTSDCTVSNVTILNSTSCISLMNSFNNHVANSTFTNGTWGIFIFNSTENDITRNSISQNLYAGIATGGPKGSGRNVIANNTIFSSGDYGIDMVGSDNRILNNNISHNTNGIVLDMAHQNQIGENIVSNNAYFGFQLMTGSSNNTIFGNLVEKSVCGLVMEDGRTNLVYHNNFVDNTLQADYDAPATRGNVWDNGLEGNYWSDYRGEDSNHDGIGDAAYTVYQYNYDKHPLMGKFSSFNMLLGYCVTIVSNSTLESVSYIQFNSTIQMLVTNATSTQSFGFCRISISYNLINASTGSISVIIDEGQTPVLFFNGTLHDNGTCRWIYFAYTQSTHEMIIIPEFSSMATLSLLVMMTILTAAGHKRRF
jgi:parallel beta-helix repeat protein